MLTLLSCRNPQRIGEEIFPPPQMLQDTLKITEVSQVFLSSVQTRNAPFAFIGEAEDSLIGRWRARWATNFALGGTDVRFITEELIAIDSVVLELFIASSYGNFSEPMRLRVERLLEPLSSTSTYTTESSFPTDGQNLVVSGRDSLFFTAMRPGGYRFLLDTALGRWILSLPPSALASERAFQTAFPGLCIWAEPLTPTAKAAVYTIFPRSALTVLRIYYRERIGIQVAPQRYDFFITDSCTWAYSLTREGGRAFRDQIASDSTLWNERLLLAGGLPVGLSFKVADWDKITRRLIVSARLYWPSDSVSSTVYSPFYPRPNSFALYADTLEEVAAAAWGLGDFVGETIIWDLTSPIQEVAVGRRPPPQYFSLWLAGRTYTLQRWIAAGRRSSTPPHLIVTSVLP